MEENPQRKSTVLRDSMVFAGTSSFFAGTYAIVMQQPFLRYSVLTAGSSFIVAGCYFNVRQGLQIVRGKDDLINTATAGGLTGFLFGGLHGLCDAYSSTDYSSSQFK
eukprot:TRINITY_DN8005_c0_g1_i3.p1 TRINITY_DN8005_c0_g1~~TRINITY_DN8005_c0_g1_i3.p1  ORF type:complete len:107 (+),score=17.48 TRINITY_DN8005_c0_g1_i3:30-350(+)